MTNQFDLPEGTMEYCMLAVIKQIPTEKMFEVFKEGIHGITKYEEGEKRTMAIIGFMAGVLSFGYYLGMDKTLDMLTEMEQEWNDAGKPDNFLDKKLESMKSNFSKFLGE